MQPNLAIVFVFILCYCIFVLPTNDCFCCARFSFSSTKQQTGGEERFKMTYFVLNQSINHAVPGPAKITNADSIRGRR